MLGGYKAAAADKNEVVFRAEPAASYRAKQTSGGVTVAAEPYTAAEKVKVAFGKTDPNRHGVMPVLVVIQNDSPTAIRIGELKVEYLGPDRSRVMATPAADVKYLTGPQKPKVMSGPTGIPKVLKRKKNPLDTWEIEGRAFSAKMIPPGESASGFFYFEARHLPGSRLYLAGLSEAGTGKELFYFEIPLAD